MGSDDEEALATVRSADFLRRPECARNVEAHALKLPGDRVSSERQMAGDVFEDAERGLALGNDTRDVGEQMPRIICAEPRSGDGERLARISRSDEIHSATPRSSVERS